MAKKKIPGLGLLKEFKDFIWEWLSGSSLIFQIILTVDPEEIIWIIYEFHVFMLRVSMFFGYKKYFF